MRPRHKAAENRSGFSIRKRAKQCFNEAAA